MKKAFLISILSISMFFLGIGNGLASVIVGPVSGTTDMTEDFPLSHTYDQSGLSANYVSGVTDFDSFVLTTTHISNPYKDFLNENGTLGYIEYDLGGNYDIGSIAFWNFGVNTTFSVTAFDLTGASNLLGTFNPFVQSNPNSAQVFSFGPINVQHFRLDNFSNNGATGLAIGEVAFGSSPVPEPATMILFGIGLLGLAGVNRRKPQ